jgi:hypothetical protein
VGFFGTYLFDGGTWIAGDLSRPPARAAKPWLLLDIHDSDIGTVLYQPAGAGSGIAYLGCTPRTYFEDETASAPTDVDREAGALAAWWAAHHAVTDPEAIAAQRAAIAGLLAADLDLSADPDAEDEDAEDEDAEDEDGFDEEPDLPDEEIFVELKAARFLRLLGLSRPEGLRGE